MRSFANTNVWTVWRYVLFDHNDSDEQLKQLWEIAKECGVKELRFTFTHVGSPSKRIRSSERLSQILPKLGVPSKKIQIFTGINNLRLQRAVLSKIRPISWLFFSVLFFWRLMNKMYFWLGKGPVVTCVGYELPAKEIQHALNMSAKYLGMGRINEFSHYYLHAKKLAERPSLYAYSGRIRPRFRRESVHRSDRNPASIPIRFRPPFRSNPASVI
jgi:hypothetical protein